MIASLRFLHATIVHKYHVYCAGRRLGVGIWQLLIHDLSKFRPSEFVPYGKFFYSMQGAGWLKAVPHNDYRPHMLHAWLRHIQRNAHHWQYHLVWRPECQAQGRYSTSYVGNAGSLEAASSSNTAALFGTSVPGATTLSRKHTSIETESATTPTTERGTPRIELGIVAESRKRPDVRATASFSITAAVRRAVRAAVKGPWSFLRSIIRTEGAPSTDTALPRRAARASAESQCVDGRSRTDSPTCFGCSVTTVIAPTGTTAIVPIRQTRILVNGASVVATRRVMSHGQTVDTNPAQCLECGRAIDGSSIDARPMPEKYVREMLADWMGAGRAYQGEYPKSIETWKWWQENKGSLILHPLTRVHLTDAIDDWFNPTHAFPDHVLEQMIWGQP
jgi:hypothetical protein